MEEYKEFLIKLAEHIMECINPLIDALKEIFDTLEPYQKYEILHPRKKPRGSIRRNKRRR